MTIFGKKINVCKMCEASAGDDPHTYKSGERVLAICDDCYEAISSICNDIIEKRLKEIKKSVKKTTVKKTTKKKKSSK